MDTEDIYLCLGWRDGYRGYIPVSRLKGWIQRIYNCVQVEGMDTEDIRSYSSMSSSEWEDQASDSSPGERDGVEVS